MAKRHTAPRHLPAAIKTKWEELYDGALTQAKVNHPGDEGAQHTVALKAANKMLSVGAPDSAEAIDKLPDWKVKHRETKQIDGVEHRVVVTIDGKKYSHPTKAAKPKPAPTTAQEPQPTS